MSRKLVGGFVALVMAAVAVTTPSQGFALACTAAIGSLAGSGCRVYASTSIVGIVAAVALVALILLRPAQVAKSAGGGPVKIIERLGAFCIDFIVLVTVAAPLVAMPMLLVEARATGSFQWVFGRDFLRVSDFVAIAFLVVFFAAFILYFHAHAVSGRQTIGQYVMGFRLEGVPGQKPSFGKNIFLGSVGLCAWPISLYLAAKRDDRQFWWNLRAHTQLVRVA